MIYCKQIPPEYQESRLFDDEGMGLDYINVTGNRDYISRTSPLFDRVYNALENGELAGSREENNILCKVLSIVTGREWDWRIIRGCCQSDWNEIFYPVDDWSREALAAFETMYFNTGSEWIIHDEENTPEGPEDISGYSCYIVADTEEGIRKELAAVAGCAPSDLVIWAFDEFIRVAQYKAV